MILNIAALGLVLLMGYLWMARGLWNSLLHFVCTLIAGAVAFGVWEPLAYLILGFAPASGFLSFLEGIAWGAALLIPFAATLAILRAISDAAIPANVQNNKAVDYAGAIVCGLGNGVITVGIVVIALGYMRLSTGFLGYRAIDYTEQRQAGGGSLERTGGLWVPVDRFVAGMYGFASETALRTGEPLAKWHPNVELAGYAGRISYGNGASRNVMRRADFQITGAWQVGDGSGRTADLLTFAPEQPPQGYVDISGEPIGAGKLVGYTVRFGAGARESSGQVIFGNGQLRLLAQNEEGDTVEAFPVALVSQAEASEADLFGRWRFDGAETFIASVGGATTVDMGFEFVVPQGYNPLALYMKHTRVMVDDLEPRRFPSPAARDAAVASGALLGGGLSVDDLDLAMAERFDGESATARGRDATVFSVDNFLGFQFQTTQKRGLELSENNQIIGGSAKYAPGELAGRGGINPELRVDRFASGDDTVILQVNISGSDNAGLLGRVARSVEAGAAPQLVDADGTVYQAVGYIYTDREIVDVRFTPANPVQSLNELPTLSSARTDQELKLIFQCSFGVSIRYLAYGKTVAYDINPPIVLDQRQR